MKKPPSDSVATWQPSPERLRALAEFAAGAGHEINNPLATIIGRAQQLLRDESDPQRRQALALIATQAYRIRDMIGDVMTFARPPRPRPELCPLEELVLPVLRSFTQKVKRESIGDSTAVAAVFEYRPTTTAGTMWSVDPTQFAVVLSELLGNALAAGARTIVVTDGIDGSLLSVKVSDDGEGFSPLEIEHAFDPFFSGRQAGRGLGFGLCKAAQIVAQHGGTVTIASAPGQGTSVTTHWALIERADGEKADGPRPDQSRQTLPMPPESTFSGTD